MKGKSRRCLELAVVIVAAGTLLAPLVWAQGHHGHGHDPLHHWYMKLFDKAGKSCCNKQDCRPTQSRVRGSIVEVVIDGEWTAVPPDKILKEQSPDLGDHVCSPKQPSSYPKGHIFCVVLGNGV